MVPAMSTACTAPKSDETAQSADRKRIVRNWNEGKLLGLMALRRLETYILSALRLGWGYYGYQAVHRASGGRSG